MSGVGGTGFTTGGAFIMVIEVTSPPNVSFNFEFSSSVTLKFFSAFMIFNIINKCVIALKILWETIIRVEF